MRLTLVAIHIEPSPRALPLGPANLASVLRRAFPDLVQTHIVDLYAGQPAAECVDRILATAPDGVGLSMYVWNRHLSMEIAALLKARAPALFVFAGGPEATADQQRVQADPAVDFVLPGEGETLIVEAVTRLLQGAAPRELSGWARQAPVKDFAGMPSPFLDGTLDLARYTGVLWELARGCPFTCSFCGEARGPAGTRRVPLERLEAELDLFQASGVSEVFVLDPTFNYSKPLAKKILSLIAERAPEVQFFFECRAEFLDVEMAALFAALNCTLQIGLQSAHVAVLKNIDRTFNRKLFEPKVLLLHEAGVAYGFDLIYGLPGDTLDGFKESLDFAMSMAPNHLDLFLLSVLPGTRLSETAAGFALEHQVDSPYSVTRSPTFGPDDLAQAGRIARACDVFYNHGKAVPWFDLVLSALRMAPSEVFERFADALEASSTDDVIELQRDFVRALFQERDADLVGSLAADLITYFGHSAALMDGAEATDSRLGAYGHDIEALVARLEAGQTDLEELALAVPAGPCEGRLRRDAGELSLEVVRT